MPSDISCGMRPKFIPNRAHDYLYDPVFTVSAPKDYIKQVMIARKLTAKYAICPVFQCMFSDLPNYPRQTLVRRVTKEVIKSNNAIENALHGKQICEQAVRETDLIGVDRHRFFSRPIIEFSSEIISYSKQPEKKQSENKLYKKPKNKHTQTVYRESSAQTKPWKTPNYIIPEGSDPELLKLDFLQDHMLPAGVHEIELIKRARIKRAWEKVLKLLSDSNNYEERRNIIEAMETDEWMFREQEIIDIQNLRMELLEQMLQEILNLSTNKVIMKIANKTEELKLIKEEKIWKIKHRTQRELRRLYRQHHGVITKYHKLNIIEEHREKKSEIYGPMMRHGVNPSRRHEHIMSNYSPHLDGIEYNMDFIPDWVYEMKASDDKVEAKGKHLCQRETKWTEPILKQIHDELNHVNEVVKKKSSLWKARNKSDVYDHLPPVEGILEKDENDYLSAVFLQSILRGRTVQTTIFEGRDKCRELIDELKSTFYLQEINSKKIKKERYHTYQQQRSREVNRNCQANLSEVLSHLEGSVVGTMLDFLNKELRRILDERKAHAIALLAKRERYMKEAAEAGRRQVEERRRREHDEMFKQLTKIHQDSVDIYLREIIMEGIESVSEEKAQEYIKDLAAKMDEELEEQEEMTFLEKEETIADMVHHFMIPEAEKINIREKIKNKQKNYLKTVHNTIYEKFEYMNYPYKKDESNDPDDTDNLQNK